MTTTLSIRVTPEELKEYDSRASARGISRTQYLREVIQAGMKAEEPPPRKFSSMDLLGKYAIGCGSTNAEIRAGVRKKLLEKHRR